jgi:hypothetical protein
MAPQSHRGVACWHMLPFRHTHMLMCVSGGGDTPHIQHHNFSSIAHVGITAQGTAHSRLRGGMRSRACVHAFMAHILKTRRPHIKRAPCAHPYTGAIACGVMYQRTLISALV